MEDRHLSTRLIGIGAHNKGIEENILTVASTGISNCPR